ncbi:MAG: 3-hydroxyacyl-ACP dehydratase FabZ [Acidobacteriia bacterium]|nr:3-hydroxyacyl-ACP dehydratase FabZ [Terriglobia bacterium]
MTQFGQSAIQRILPHRYPFLLIDRVTELEPGKRIVGIKNFTGNEEPSLGYAPDSSQVPTAILLEAVTQLGAILVLERPEMAGKVAFILQIPSATLHKPVVPGDTLRMEAEVLKMGERFGELRGTAYRAGELVAEGQMRFAVADAKDILPA